VVTRSGSSRLVEGDACSVCEDDGLHPISEVEFLEDVCDVRFDGGFADVELLADFGVGQATRYQAEDLEFTFG
jgi:hypothetical protein